jgi:ubiquinone/menaquinone biosynthesis C-methylase UbiE
VFESLYNNSDEIRREKIIGQFEEDNTSVYFDIGVGDGQFAKRCIERIKPGKAFGVDYRDNLKAGLDLSAGGKTKFELLIADIGDGLPLPDASVDIVTCSQVVEHLPNTDAFLIELYRILKPGGYAIISTENLSSWDDIFAILLGYRPFSVHYSYLRMVGNPFSPHNNEDISSSYDSSSGRFYGHNKIFTLKAFRALATLYNFEVVSIYGAGYYPVPSKALMKFFSRVDKLHSKFMVVRLRKPCSGRNSDDNEVS